jgi:serine protease inhibitor
VRREPPEPSRRRERDPGPRPPLPFEVIEMPALPIQPRKPARGRSIPLLGARLGALALAVSVLAGCGSAAGAEFARSQATQPPASASAAAEAATAVNAFGLDALRLVGTGNAVISPASIALAVAMARAGAAGETASQMDTVLHGLYGSGGGLGLGSLGQSLNGLSGSFTDAMGKTQSIELNVTHAVWSQVKMALVQAFLDSLAVRFDAGLRLTDFAADPAGATKAINAWVNEQTKGRIPNLLDSLDPSTRMVLVNAIYLKAAWKEPFQEASTKDGTFHALGGKDVTVATMHGFLEEAKYAAGTGWRAVELTYGNGPLAMDIVVPDDFAAFGTKLDEALFGQIAAGMKKTPVSFSMPKFKTETKAELTDLLTRLGMPLAFDPDRADFSGITAAEKLYIGAVIHQANISVDEKGTEAAAATAVVMKATAMPSEPVALDVDRPFYFAVRDTASGAVLFLGRIANPAA